VGVPDIIYCSGWSEIKGHGSPQPIYPAR